MPILLARTPRMSLLFRAMSLALLILGVAVSAHAEPRRADMESSVMPRLQLSLENQPFSASDDIKLNLPALSGPDQELMTLLRALAAHVLHTQKLILAQTQGPLFIKDRVRVAIYSYSGERLTLQSQRHVTIAKDAIILRKTTRSYEDFCTTPCHLEVTAGAYRFVVADGETWRKARTLDVRRRIDIRQDSELWLKRKSRRPARAGFYSAMAASVVAGLAVGIVSAIEQRDKSLSLSPSRGPLMGALSAGLVLSGAGFFAGGMVSRDTYEVIARPYAPTDDE